jgi:hypothetical protein
MHYLVYKLTNKVNQKIYIGVHQTSNINDGYLGSGVLLARAKEKYGESVFEKEILFDYDSPEKMFAKEKELVEVGNNSYNLKCGGNGGVVNMKATEYYKSGRQAESSKRASKLAIIAQKKITKNRQENYNSTPTLCGTCGLKLPYKSRHNKFCNKSCAASLNNAFRQHSNETKKKIGQGVKNFHRRLAETD